MTFADATWTDLAAYAPGERLVAVVRCRSAEAASPGSRRARHLMQTTVLAGAAAQPAGAALAFQRYGQGEPPMRAGGVYLVAATLESKADPWALLEAVPVGEGDAAAALQGAQAEAARRIKP